MLEKIDSTPISVSQICTWTCRDLLLSKVYCFVQFGWPTSVPAELQPYFVKRDELSITDQCLLWGSRLVIPPPGRKPLLEELHEAHPGTS